MRREARPPMASRALGAMAALAGAALVSQAPAFADQYLQRLAGRLDQARFDVARIEQAARAETMTLGDYIAAFTTSANSAHRRQGRILQDQVADRTRLEAALAALREARPWQRPLRLVSHGDGATARATLADFAPALPLGPSGLLYALGGALLGLGVKAGMARAIAMIPARRRRSA